MPEPQLTTETPPVGIPEEPTSEPDKVKVSKEDLRKLPEYIQNEQGEAESMVIDLIGIEP